MKTISQTMGWSVYAIGPPSGAAPDRAARPRRWRGRRRARARGARGRTSSPSPRLSSATDDERRAARARRRPCVLPPAPPRRARPRARTPSDAEGERAEQRTPSEPACDPPVSADDGERQRVGGERAAGERRGRRARERPAEQRAPTPSAATRQWPASGDERAPRRRDRWREGRGCVGPRTTSALGTPRRSGRVRRLVEPEPEPRAEPDEQRHDERGAGDQRDVDGEDRRDRRDENDARQQCLRGSSRLARAARAGVERASARDRRRQRAGRCEPRREREPVDKPAEPRRRALDVDERERG